MALPPFVQGDDVTLQDLFNDLERSLSWLDRHGSVTAAAQLSQVLDTLRRDLKEPVPMIASPALSARIH